MGRGACLLYYCKTRLGFEWPGFPYSSGSAGRIGDSELHGRRAQSLLRGVSDYQKFGKTEGDVSRGGVEESVAPGDVTEAGAGWRQDGSLGEGKRAL